MDILNIFAITNELVKAKSKEVMEYKCKWPLSF